MDEDQDRFVNNLGGGKILPGLQDFLKSGEFGGNDTAYHLILLIRSMSSNNFITESNVSGLKDSKERYQSAGRI